MFSESVVHTPPTRLHNKPRPRIIFVTYNKDGRRSSIADRYAQGKGLGGGTRGLELLPNYCFVLEVSEVALSLHHVRPHVQLSMRRARAPPAHDHQLLSNNGLVRDTPPNL